MSLWTICKNDPGRYHSAWARSPLILGKQNKLHVVSWAEGHPDSKIAEEIAHFGFPIYLIFGTFQLFSNGTNDFLCFSKENTRNENSIYRTCSNKTIIRINNMKFYFQFQMQWPLTFVTKSVLSLRLVVMWQTMLGIRSWYPSIHSSPGKSFGMLGHMKYVTKKWKGAVESVTKATMGTDVVKLRHYLLRGLICEKITRVTYPVIRRLCYNYARAID